MKTATDKAARDSGRAQAGSGISGPGTAEVELREPRPDDGVAVFELVARCPPLDANSRYCNLLQCSHFAATSIIATAGGGEVLGFLSGYRVPARPDTLFVWQVAVDPAARGLGLGSRLLAGLLGRAALADIRFLETTVGPDNRASRALFQRFARQRSAATESVTLFETHRHFAGCHADEILLRIGPLPAASS